MFGFKKKNDEDSYFTSSDIDYDFKMLVDSINKLEYIGCFAFGEIQSGSIKAGQKVQILDSNGYIKCSAKVEPVKQFSERYKNAKIGDTIVLKFSENINVEVGDLVVR